MSRLIGLIALALVAVPASASAATFTVNDDALGVGPAGASCAAPNSATISGAVALASPFDTIAVCSGTYPETVVMNKRLVLNGPQAGIDARGRTGVPEAIVEPSAGTAFAISEGALIDGFTFRGASTAALDYGLVGNGHTENVRNNVFEGNYVAATGVFGKDSAFSRNRITGPTFRGVDARQSSESLEISENVFAGVTGGDIVFTAPGPFDDTLISGNVHANGSGDFVDLRNNDDTVITGNLVLGAATAINIRGGSNGTQIARNVITGGGGADAITLAVEPGLPRNSGTRILSNSISGKLAAVRVTSGSASTSDLIEVQFNRIVGNAAGVINEAGSGGSVLATNNFWGCNEGPGEPGCDSIAGTVTASPNLVLRVSASPETIESGGDTSRIKADVITNSAGVEVNAVSGTFPGGQPVSFRTTRGKLDPESTPLESGLARTELTSGNETGTARVRASLDNETVLVPVEIVDPDSLPDQPGDKAVACTGVFKGRIIRGTPGVDRLEGTGDGERIRGRGGNDRIDGKAGGDCVSGGRGADRILAVDGEVDRIRCGGKIDRVKADPVDIIKSNCEKLKIVR